jgi:crotonobetainyl-CoA:carnitine CoA-transferase CaiB-like acyl-CoA transferase
LQDRIPVREDGTDMQYPLNDDERKIILEELPEIFETEPRQVWLDRLLAADICAIPELHPGEVFDEPQVRHNDMVVEVDDPDLGRLEQVAPAAKFRNMAAAVRSGAPTVGQHTAAVRAERPAAATFTTSESTAVRDVPLLEGVRILDLGAYYAGPFSSRLLADLGADVIKLETTVGDQLRGIARPFRSAQAGKRGIALNLKDPDLAEARTALIEWADVICHNMRPGAAERVGLGYEQVSECNPGVIYLYAPGWGSSGPDSQRQSFAPMVSGYVGVGYEVAGRFNPPMWPLGNEDPGNGLLGAVAILMGLLVRQRRGNGTYVENPQINATMTHLAHVVRRPDGEVLGAERLDPLQMGISPLDRLYETSDGWLCVVAATDDEVRRLGKVLAIDIVEDARFSSHDARVENEDELADLLSDVIAGRTTRELLDALRAEGVAAMEPKTENNNSAFHRDPVNQAIGRIAEVDTERYGRIREPANLVRVSDAKHVPHRVAPELGEHTGEVLRDLGYDDTRISGLRERGSIR